MRHLALTIATLTATAITAPAFGQNLEYGSYLPPGHISNHYGLSPLFAKVAEETNGETKINLQAGGALAGAKDTLSSIENGMIDGGFIVSVYVPDDIPLNNSLSDLVTSFTDPVASMGAINETMLIDCPECVQEYENKNVVALGAYSTTPYKLLCREPITNLSQVAGKKIRSAGDVWGRWIDAMGAVPVNVPNSEAYEAMQRGQIDCVYGSVGWLKTLSLWDVAKNVLDQNMGSFAGGSFISFNADSWEGMDEAARESLLTNIPDAMAAVAFAYKAEDERALAEGAEKGVVVHAADPAISDLLKKHTETEIALVTADAERRGATNVQTAHAALLENIEKWTKIAEEVGDDQEAFAEALRREIYSKIKP